MKRSASHSVLTASLLAVFSSSPTFGESSGTASLNVHGDFNDDGYSDLAIGVPHQKVGSAVWAGEVHIFYGGDDGLRDLDEIISENSSGMPVTAQAYDEFGSALATGDFDRDGYSDLAIGAPGRSIGSISSTGIVIIVYGSFLGLNPARNWMFNQNVGGIADACESGDRFGRALATGDFNHDFYSDLLVGVAHEALEGHSNTGAVHALYGSSTGLKAVNSQFWYQDSTIEGSTADGDHFGWAVAAGDFNGDYYDDAAIGVPDDLSSGAGAVNIIMGSNSGLTATGSMRFYRGDSHGVDGPGFDGDEFGAALAVGNFNGDHYDDLAIGAYGTRVCPDCAASGTGLAGYLLNAGSVTVLYGGSDGLNGASSRTDQWWTQAGDPHAGDIHGALEEADWFGYSLAVGDFDADDYDDLIVGAPGEGVGVDAAAGAVNLIFGSSVGLDPDAATENQIWYQDSDGILGGSEEDDIFGWALAVGDFNDDGKDDVAIGVPKESVDGISQAGCINVMYGYPYGHVGLDDFNNAIWHRGSSGILGSLQTSALFGSALASGR